MWNGPVEIAIDDLFIILGPNLNVVSHDDSFIDEKSTHPYKLSISSIEGIGGMMQNGGERKYSN